MVRSKLQQFPESGNMKSYIYNLTEEQCMELQWLFSGQIIQRNNEVIEVHLNNDNYEFVLSWAEWFDKEVIIVQ
jgi:hypothetical protein